MTRIKYRNGHLKLVAIVLISFIACLGTIPFGYHFVETIRIQQALIKPTLGYAFAATAAFSNLALGTYSLLCIGRDPSSFNPLWLLPICILIAIPTGFISFWGYFHTLPFTLNVITSVAVILANAGIDYTAINNFTRNIRENWGFKSEKNNVIRRSIIRVVGFMFGFIASFTFFVVATDGLINFLPHLRHIRWWEYTCYSAAFIIWLPSAALFGNSTQYVTDKIVDAIERKAFNSENNSLKVIILIISIFSGSSLAQIVMEFFSMGHAIPLWLKTDAIQTTIYYIFMPLAYISSAAVNYVALSELAINWRLRKINL